MRILVCIFFYLSSSLYARSDCGYMSDIQQKVIQKVCAKYDCSCSGTGGAAFYDVDKIFLAFRFERIYSEMEFRIMAIDVADIFINEINKNKVIRPYLRRYPASLLTIQLDFFFPYHIGEICSGGLIGGRLDTWKDSGEEFTHIDGINETYEEALQKIQFEKEKSNLPKLF
jgi:hypothetical protein